MKDEALKLALEALEKLSMGGDPRWADDVIPAIKQALAAPVQEPVAWIYSQGAAKVVSMNYVPGVRATPLYTTPPAAPVQEPESFEQWNAKQHGDPEEIGFLQALRIAYCAGQDSVTKATPPAAQLAPVQEPEYWNVIDPAGNIVASETDAIRGWARIAGSYKPTVEGLLGFHDQGWRVLPKATPPAAQQGLDWKAEYLKSVESGCITLDELREANAELEATNRQVEILSDALAESRREIAALKAVQEPVAWRWVPSKVWQDYVLSDDPQKAALAREHGIEVEALCKCTTPPAAQRQWMGLTDEEVDAAIKSNWGEMKGGPLVLNRMYVRAIEAKLRSKNGY